MVGGSAVRWWSSSSSCVLSSHVTLTPTYKGSNNASQFARRRGRRRYNFLCGFEIRTRIEQWQSVKVASDECANVNNSVIYSLIFCLYFKHILCIPYTVTGAEASSLPQGHSLSKSTLTSNWYLIVGSKLIDPFPQKIQSYRHFWKGQNSTQL